MLKRIEQHTIENPITIPTLAQEFAIDERKAKECIGVLVDNGFKIGSSKRKPYGMFIARNPEEIYETAMRLREEGLHYLWRAKKLLDFKGAEPTLFEQFRDVPEDLQEVLNDPIGALEKQSSTQL